MIQNNKVFFIFSVFYGCGKDYLIQNQYKYGLTILDLSDYYVDFDDEINIQFFLDKLRDNIGKYNVIFIPNDVKFWDLLFENKIFFILVYPNYFHFNKYINTERYSKEFVDKIRENWLQYHIDFERFRKCLNYHSGRTYELINNKKYLADLCNTADIEKMFPILNK
jgi:hypothetical protein